MRSAAPAQRQSFPSLHDRRRWGEALPPAVSPTLPQDRGDLPWPTGDTLFIDLQFDLDRSDRDTLWFHVRLVNLWPAGGGLAAVKLWPHGSGWAAWSRSLGEP